VSGARGVLRRTALLGAAAAWVALGGCRSPEAGRARGGGPGADVGNRDPVVEMHEGSKMYYDTPCLMPSDKCTGPGQASGASGEFPDSARRRG
jgi:hypothetical protein